MSKSKKLSGHTNHTKLNLQLHGKSSIYKNINQEEKVPDPVTEKKTTTDQQKKRNVLMLEQDMKS